MLLCHIPIADFYLNVWDFEVFDKGRPERPKKINYKANWTLQPN